MNRQRLALLRIAPLHIQQGLFASLALLVTLLAGQQFQRWQDSQAPAPRVPVHHSTHPHFTSVSNQLSDPTPAHWMAADQAQPALDAPRQERWVF